MKRLFLSLCMVAGAWASYAQVDDPVIMTVNGKDVTRSEFEYSYNKNNTDMVIDKKSLDEYVDLFINYKLKVAAAEEAKLDTSATFKEEMEDYRTQQAESYLIDTVFIENEARNTYEMTRQSIGEQGMFRCSHILVFLEQQATAEQQRLAKERIDSIYGALKAGADFGELATKLSQDPGSAAQKGELPWLYQGQTLKEFEQQAFALQPGEMSEPFLSPVGYHIILMQERKQFEPYEFHRENIIEFLKQRGILIRARQSMGAKLAHQMGGGITPYAALKRAERELDQKYPEFGYLMKEYHDGSLLYEISTREVWDKAAKDEKGLAKFYKKNKKKYRYEEPMYRGLVLHCVSEEVLEGAKKLVKKQPQDEWVKLIRAAYNSDSLIQVKMVRGPFKQGKNAFVDYYIFESEEKPEAMEGFPANGVVGKLQKKGPDSYKDVRGLVTADYQSYMETLWVKELRERYPVKVYEDVLKTVNNHD